MSKRQDILDDLVAEASSLTNDLSDSQKKEVDIYFEQLVKEIGPALDAIDKISKDPEVMSSVKNAFTKEIKEQKWLEKLSKTFWDLENTTDPTKTQEV